MMEQVRRRYEEILRTEGSDAAWEFAQGIGLGCSYPDWY